MIRLSAWSGDIDLGYGVTVTVKPVTTWIHRAAQHSAERMVRELAYEGGLIEAAGGSIHDIPDLHQREGMLGLRDQLMLQALARHAISEWQGVADEDGAPIPPYAGGGRRAHARPSGDRRSLRDRVSARAGRDVRRGKRIGRRADWHFGGGAGYCGHCVELGEPCADGRRAATASSARTPEYAPQTLEGEIAWGLLVTGQWQRGGMDGRLAGLDIAACLARPAARGADPDVLEYLLAVGETAAVTRGEPQGRRLAHGSEQRHRQAVAEGRRGRQARPAGSSAPTAKRR